MPLIRRKQSLTFCEEVGISSPESQELADVEVACTDIGHINTRKVIGPTKQSTAKAVANWGTMLPDYPRH